MKSIINICWATTWIFLLALSAPAGYVDAAPITLEGLTLEVPPGFDGPISLHPDSNSTTAGFRKPHAGTATATLLQITIYDFGEEIPMTVSNEERSSDARQYLLQMLDGIKQRRTSFVQTEPERITLAGTQGWDAVWHGKYANIEVSGKMYCVVIGSKVYIFHT